MTLRERALATMTERFPLVSERFRQTWGLQLPRHVAVFAALAASDRTALNEVGLSPWGVTDYFSDGGLDMVGRDGLDERLHARYRCDPAEFITVISGDTDGLHYGLWFDDPAELPTLIAYNYARDSAETWVSSAPSLVAAVHERVDRILADYGDEPEEVGRVRPLIEAIEWFTAADQDALRQDGMPRAAPTPRSYLATSLLPQLPSHSGDPQAAPSTSRLDAFRNDQEQAFAWIAEANHELAAGEPALALAIGSELHWLDLDDYRQAGLDLLVGAIACLAGTPSPRSPRCTRPTATSAPSRS